MYQVGEYIVHPGQGVCKVEAIAEGPTAVYELMPIGQRHPMKISFPVASEAKLRPVLSREEAQELIDQYPTIPVEDFRDRSNALEEEHFKNEIRRGTCRDTVRIVKTFRARIAQTKANNKKPPAAYERILAGHHAGGCHGPFPEQRGGVPELALPKQGIQGRKASHYCAPGPQWEPGRLFLVWGWPEIWCRNGSQDE